MKKIFLFSVLSLSFILNMNIYAKIDPAVKPEPLPAKEFKFPEYETITLKNGLKVFVIKDDQQPTVSFRIMINGGSLVDGTHAGLSSITAQMLTKGTSKYSALDIANKLDGLGINLGASSSADFTTVAGASLKKHFPTLLEITKEILTAPTFPQDELDKLKKLTVANIKQEKSKGSAVAAAISRIALYGADHPYSKMQTEEGINSLTTSDLKSYFKNYIVPNNATMTVTGDVTAKEVKSMLEKHFADWKQGKKLDIKIPEVKPEPIGVYFVSRPGAVQSSINIVSMAVPRNHPDYDKLGLSSSIIGAGFAGRLFKTLRETYSYTYTPFGFVTGTKYTNRFACGADVRADVTDSSVSVILEQLKLLTEEVPSTEELDLLKKYEVGQYMMSFSNKDYTSMLIQNADFYGLDINKVKDYHLRLLKYNESDMREMARKYMNPRSSYIVVVGDPSNKEKLAKFGKIYEYNTDYEPVTGAKAKAEKVDMTPKQLMEKYHNAIGGASKINEINSIEVTGKLEFDMQGQAIPGSVTEKYQRPNKKYAEFDLGIMQTRTYYNGKEGWMAVGPEMQQATGTDLDRVKAQSEFMRDARLLEIGYKMEIIGKQKNYIVAKVTRDKEELTYYFDASSYLLVKKEYNEVMPAGLLPVTETYGDYKEFGGVKFPTSVSVSTPQYSYTSTVSYELNKAMNDADFAPKK